MSASSKKKLRKEQEAAKLTEKQLTAQKEAKKTKLYTVAFVTVMIVILAIAVTVGINQTIGNSGIRERNTTALTIGEHELSNADLNYYFIDTVNNFYSQNGSYAALFGLDVSLPLDQQYFSEESGETWADYFLDYAKSTAQSVYAMNDAAKAEGFTMPEDVAANVDSMMSTFNMYASLMGYADTETYIKAMYGKGATAESLRNYIEMSMLAEAYSAAHEESLVYSDEDLRAAEAENFDKYSSFDYNYYYLAASRFLEGGTTNEDGTTTYTEEEEAASIAAAEAAAKAVASAEIASVEDLDAAIAALPVNAEITTAKSTAYTNYSYDSIDADLAAWLCDSARQEGDVACVTNNTTSTNEDGTETTEILGYYVAMFHSKNDNVTPMKNVRHILVSFEGGTTDELGNTAYSDEEKAAAKTAAEEILNEWLAGEATEDSFAALATERTDDTGSSANGGLYEDIYPGQMVEPFETWCYDASRATGDTGIVETTYGYHVMYFVGNSEMTYRDFQITEELSSADHSAWTSAIVNSVSVVDGNTKYLTTGIVLGANG